MQCEREFTERDILKDGEMERKTSRVWKVSLINIPSYTVEWRETERRGTLERQ